MDVRRKVSSADTLEGIYLKKAFVFDTNFIIENVDLAEVVKNLSEDFNVYVARVSIDERLSQKYLELKKRYDKITALSREYGDIARISLKKSFQEKVEREREYTEQGYVRLFGDRIIPFFADKDTFQQTLDRVHKKTPPFSSVDGASDKGFKDALLWISLMQFFKSNGEDEVVFLTNDGGFRKNTEYLCAEFTEVTGKIISINENGHYKLLVEKKSTGVTQETTCDTPLPDVRQLREKTQEVIQALCVVESENGWGDPIWETTFSLSSKLTSENVDFIFSHLKQLIANHLFELGISAEKVIEMDAGITSGVQIPMCALENALSLYEEILKKLPEYMPQFLSATASILNGNFSEPHTAIVDEDDLPF